MNEAKKRIAKEFNSMILDTGRHPNFITELLINTSLTIYDGLIMGKFGKIVYLNSGGDEVEESKAIQCKITVSSSNTKTGKEETFRWIIQQDDYLVTWTIDSDETKGFEQAARDARNAQYPGTESLIFTVTNKRTGESRVIDLLHTERGDPLVN